METTFTRTTDQVSFPAARTFSQCLLKPDCKSPSSVSFLRPRLTQKQDLHVCPDSLPVWARREGQCEDYATTSIC